MTANPADPKAHFIENIRWQCAGFRALGSPFYDRLGEELATAVVEDGSLWTTVAPFAEAPVRDAYVLRLFAGIHRMALEGSVPRLSAHFPSTGGDGDAHAAMEAVIDLIDPPPAPVRDALAVPPQTNEVGRAPALASGLLTVASLTGLPIRVREIGSSGGLNLRLDSYWYGQDDEGWGDRESPVRFVDLWRAGSPDFSHGAVIADRRGCDRHPIDASTSSGALTLMSYVWPEPGERFVRLQRALEIARATPVTIDQADAADWVPRELSTMTEGTALVLMHSVVWQYLEEATAAVIHEAVAEAGAAASPDSPLAWLRLEPNPETYAPAELKLTLWNGSHPQERLLATTTFHGGTIAWQ